MPNRNDLDLASILGCDMKLSRAPRLEDVRVDHNPPQASKLRPVVAKPLPHEPRPPRVSLSYIGPRLASVVDRQMLGVHVPPQLCSTRREVSRPLQDLLGARSALLDYANAWHLPILCPDIIEGEATLDEPLAPLVLPKERRAHCRARMGQPLPVATASGARERVAIRAMALVRQDAKPQVELPARTAVDRDGPPAGVRRRPDLPAPGEPRARLRAEFLGFRDHGVVDDLDRAASSRRHRHCQAGVVVWLTTPVKVTFRTDPLDDNGSRAARLMTRRSQNNRVAGAGEVAPDSSIP